MFYILLGGEFMPNILTEKELCKVFSVSRVTLKKYRDLGMPYFLLGGRYIRYDFDSVLNWLHDNSKDETA